MQERKIRACLAVDGRFARDVLVSAGCRHVPPRLQGMGQSGAASIGIAKRATLEMTVIVTPPAQRVPLGE